MHLHDPTVSSKAALTQWWEIFSIRVHCIARDKRGFMSARRAAVCTLQYCPGCPCCPPAALFALSWNTNTAGEHWNARCYRRSVVKRHLSSIYYRSINILHSHCFVSKWGNKLCMLERIPTFHNAKPAGHLGEISLRPLSQLIFPVCDGANFILVAFSYECPVPSRLLHLAVWTVWHRIVIVAFVD